MKRGIIIFATMLFHTVISMPGLPGIQEKQLEDTTSLLEGFPDLNPFKNICLGFVGQDIGHPGKEGCAESTGATLITVRWGYVFGGPYKIKGSGKGISYYYDQFHYFMQVIPIVDYDFEAHVRNFHIAGHQGGIMVREDASDDSKYFALLIDGNGDVWQKVRHHKGHNTESSKISSGASMGSDVFMRVSVVIKWRTRWGWWGWLWVIKEAWRDLEFHSYYRKGESDGWIEVGSKKTLRVALFDDTFSGIAVTSQNNAELAKLDVKEIKYTFWGSRSEDELEAQALEVESCSPSARKLRLQLSSTADNIQAIEIQVTFSQIEYPQTFQTFNDIEHPDSGLDESSYQKGTSTELEIDLGKNYPLESVVIFGRSDIHPDALCQVSGATITLVNESGEEITSITIGDDTCGKTMLEYAFDELPDFCASNKAMHLTEKQSMVSQTTLFVREEPYMRSAFILHFMPTF